MTTDIILSGYGKFNVTRVTKMLNAANKEEATKLGKFDRFAEFFRLNKKYDKLCVLYDDLHAGIDSESTAPEAKQESNLNRIVIFYRMEQLAKTGNIQHSYNFKIELLGDGRELIFKIDDESIYETRSNIDDSISHQDTHETFTNGSIAEIKQIVNMLDDIEQGFFHEEYHITFYEVYSAIRHCKYNDFPSIHSDIDDEFRDSYRRGVVNNNLADVPKFNFLEFKAKSSGVRNPSKHSIIFYKLEGEYRILIKPNIQLSEYRRKYDPSKIMGNHPLRIGNSKAVKTLGIEITMSNAKELVSIKQVVTGKLYNPYPEDGITSTDDSYINQMVNDGYGLVMYKKVKVNSSDRVFVQDYLGESLLIHLQLNKFSIEQRLKIIQLHWEKIYFDMLIYHDTKLDNVLLESNKIDKVHVIDFFHMDARYLPHREVFERLTSQKQIEKSHVFQFLYLYYKIYQNDVVCVDSEVDDVDRQELGQINELNLSKGNPFAEPLQRAWRCELEWEECKREVNNILYPHQYVGPVGGGESSFAEPIRIYV